MLPEMRYVEQELLPMLREHAGEFHARAERQLAQWRGEKGVCSLMLSVSGVPEAEELPDYDLYEIHYDPEKMFISELKKALGTALAKGDGVPSLRANVGVAALCTLYGRLKSTYFHDKMPWLLQHFSHEELEEISIECLQESEEFRAGLEQMRYMKEMLRGTGIGLYPMDLQGPVDMAHLFMGDDFFYDVYDEPELVHKALKMSVKAASYAMRKCLEIIEPKEYVCHYNNLVLPAQTPLKISEDTSTLLGRAHLWEYMKPYTEQLLEEFGGGYIHYCGDNRHLLEIMPLLEKSIGLNFGNPERHDPKAILDMLGSVGKCYYGAFPGFSAAEMARLCRQEDGRFNAFITASCRASEQDVFIDEFRSSIK